VPKRIDIYHNTIVAMGEGILITGADPAYPQRVRGNAVFAAKPISGGQQAGNVTAPYSAAAQYLAKPGGTLGSTLDLYPLTGKLQGATVDTSYALSLLDGELDFNKTPRSSTFYGAYSGDGVNPGWRPALAIMP